MTTIAITGATGFLGSALARALIAQGHKVIVLTRPTSDRGRLDGLPVRRAEGDVTAPESLTGRFLEAEQYIHAAGMLGQAGVPEKRYHELHVEGTRNVLDAVKRSGAERRVLVVSSPGVLGPIRGAAATETAPLAPSNAYERSKAAAETLALAYAAEGMQVVLGRPEFVYGPGDEHVLGLFRTIQNRTFFYIGGGHNACHPTYVEDAVDGLLLCLSAGRQGEAYHIAGPEPVTFRTLASTIADALGVPAPRTSIPRAAAILGATVLELAGGATGWKPALTTTGVAFFSEDRRFSYAKAARELGYVPQFDLAAGVTSTVTWYREQGWL